MLKRIFSALAFICLAVGAHATVTVNANGVGNLVLSASGTPLAVGDIIRIGFFSSSANLGTDNSFSDLNSIFTPIGEGISNAGTLTESGNAGNTLDINNSSSVNGAFLGSYGGVSSTYLTTPSAQLYMWVFNSTTPSSATQWGIFDASTWTFPPDPGNVTLSLGSSGITVFRGSVNGSNFDLANVGAVPEPGTLSLMAGGLAVGAMALRRRK